jgi:hypothetical protein
MAGREVVQREDRWLATSRPEAKITADLIRGQGELCGFASGRRDRFPPGTQLCGSIPTRLFSAWA